MATATNFWHSREDARAERLAYARKIQHALGSWPISRLIVPSQSGVIVRDLDTILLSIEAMSRQQLLQHAIRVCSTSESIRTALFVPQNVSEKHTASLYGLYVEQQRANNIAYKGTIVYLDDNTPNPHNTIALFNSKKY